MDSRVVVTVVIGLAAFIVLLAFFWCPARRKGVYSDPTICAEILACKGYGIAKSKNLHTPLESRAIPNERLVRAYGIDNSFTTTNKDYSNEFSKIAGSRLNLKEAEWQEVATFATKLIRQAVSPSNLTVVEQMKSVTLDSLVRSVCLKIILHVLYKKDPLRMDDENISTIAEKINSLWIQSKEKKTPAESDKDDYENALAKDKDDLENALAQVALPKWDRSKPRENPLNLILPAYETLWRVVLSGFLQVTFVKGVDPGLRSILARFLAEPTVKARKTSVPSAEGLAVSVDSIVKEALRLYPSVKRVYRQFHMDNRAGPEDVAADVESCQRSEVIWAPNADRYVPSRWNDVSNEAEDSYMAFGVSPFLCPAKAVFGPMMIGILVAAFAGQVSSDDWYLKLSDSSSGAAQRDFDKALNGEKPLVSDRSTYEGIRIIKK